jgi:hypothetical protein
MEFTVTKKWKGFTDRRWPVTAEEALDAIDWAKPHTATVVVEITDSRGVVVSEAQLRKAAKARRA